MFGVASTQTQLSSYSEKFDVVQETLTKSNQMFTTFREEMDKVSRHDALQSFAFLESLTVGWL